MRKCHTSNNIHPLLPERIVCDSERNQTFQVCHKLRRLCRILGPREGGRGIRVEIRYEVDNVVPHVTDAKHVEEVRGMRLAQGGAFRPSGVELEQRTNSLIPKRACSSGAC